MAVVTASETRYSSTTSKSPHRQTNFQNSR